ncbi:MAG: NAD(P)H-hydrate dehydratase [Pseudomonadota bacterium]
MRELLTAARMRAIEQAAIVSGAVTGLELMERAGRGVVAAIFETWPELARPPGRVVVLCGPGNNGGDGFVVARLLKEHGCRVTVFLCGAPDRLPPDARANYMRWRRLGRVEDATTVENEAALAALGADIFVDALFGTGLTRPVATSSGFLRPFFDFSRRWKDADHPARTVSVDMPSGMCSDSGRALGGIMLAALTVTFHGPKVGHHLATGRAGAAACGRLICADIGLSGHGLPQSVRIIEDVEGRLGKSVPAEHKYDHGHALILCGPPGKTGAARLAARGALRIGAGLTTLAGPACVMAENAARLEAIMLRETADARGLAALLQDRRVNALCIGPGAGTGSGTRDMVAVALDRDGERAVVLDADALSAFADGPEALFALTHGKPVVLTPHGGEFGRLFPDIAAALDASPARAPAYSKVDAARHAAARAGCTVLFKGPDTVIADAQGRCTINSAHYDRAAPWLATAGSGDVLAGFVAGLLARGFEPRRAAEVAAWLHVECALEFGPGLIAEDLPEQLPKVFRRLKI